MDRQIRIFLRKLQRRLGVQMAMDIFPLFLSVGFLIGIFHVLPACFYPFYYAGRLGIFWIFACMLCGLCYFLFHLPKEAEAAHTGDAVIGKERLLTALELRGNDSAISCLQKEDTLARISSCSPGKDFPFSPPVKRILFSCLACFAFFFFLFLPSDAKAEAQHLKEIRQEAKKEITALSNLQKELQKEKELETAPGTEGKAVKEPKTAGGKLLAHGKFEDVQNLLEETKQKLSSTKSKTDLERTNVKLLASLSKYKEKAYASSYDELEAFSEVLEKVRNIQNSSQEHPSGSQNGENGTQGGSSGSQNGENGNQSGNPSSQNGENGTQSGSSGSQDVENGNSNETSSHQNGEGESSGNDSGSDTRTNNRNHSGSNGAGNENSSGNGSGNSNGSNNKNGNASGSGTGLGHGSENGSGKNYGSKQGIERESKRNQNKEQITIMSEALGSEKNLTGRASKDGNSQTQTSSNPPLAGTKKDFEEVVSEYADSAYAALENNQIPSSMKYVVQNYFYNLNS